MPKHDSSMFQIHEIGALELDLIIEFRTPLGKYWSEVSPNKFVAVDNTTGDAWTEEFDDNEIMMDWLNKKFEIGEIEQWKSIKKTEHNVVNKIIKFDYQKYREYRKQHDK